MRILPSLAILGSLLFLLVPFIYAFAFCFPGGDDFDEASRAMFLFDLPGGIYEICREWLTWSGRYTYHFMAVFWGKAVEYRPLAGLLCFCCLLSHGLGAALASRAIGRSIGFSALFGLLFLLAVCCCHQFLPVFYVQTDALTCGLQSGTWLIFLASLINTWRGLAENAPHAARSWKYCLICGITAIGIYEHAALAVFITATVAYVLAHLYASGKNSQPCARAFKSRIFRLVLYLLLALLISFLAPGNFQRRLIRGAAQVLPDNPLWTIATDWLTAMKDFCFSLWPPFMIALALFWRICRRTSSCGHVPAFALVCATIIGFGCFSIALATIHAFSDAPLSSAVKLRASLGIYAAVALGLICHALFKYLPQIEVNSLKTALGIVPLAVCLAIAGTSNNFRETAINAANGQLAIYGRFMDARYAYLRERCKNPDWRRFGLAGEYARGGRRRSRPGAGWEHVTIPAVLVAPFPLAYGDSLKQACEQWPNPWAAWLYGLAGVAATLPEYGNMAEDVAKGARIELAIPDEAKKHGIRAAWNVRAPFEANPDFNVSWVVFQAGQFSDCQFRILRPNPVLPDRLAPECLQELWLDNLLARQSPGLDLSARLAATEMIFWPEQWRDKDYYAFPVAVECTGEGLIWPHAIFARIGNGPFFRLMPYVN